MLQRAARNAYSWWWASHVRTKQSKWLEDNLQDMEEKVEYILKIIDEDGDTFAQRAEMYYRKRPEIVNFVEDSFRGYRALAERFDHISRELQSANRTIATVFPESVELRMEDADDFDNEGNLTDNNNKITRNAPAAPQFDKIPKLFPVFERKKSKMPTRLMSKKGLLKIDSAKNVAVIPPKSGLQKPDALERIDELQKGILALQTEKEFVKYSYEKGIERYGEIEKQITEMQEEVSNLQDEFGIGTVIEDDEARTIMTKTALKSCQETLTWLQHKQEQSVHDAREEIQKIQNAQEKISILSNQDMESSSIDQVGGSTGHDDVRDLESLRRKMKEDLRISTGYSLTTSELAEKVDELVDKIIKLESSVQSHGAFVQRLKLETKDLNKSLQSLEAERENNSMIEKENMNDKITKIVGELQKVQSLKQRMNKQVSLLQTGFAEASFNIEDLSEKLQNVKPDEEADIVTATGVPGVNTSENVQLQETMLVNNASDFNEQPSVPDKKIMAYPVLNSDDETAAKKDGNTDASHPKKSLLKFTSGDMSKKTDECFRKGLDQQEVKKNSPSGRTVGEKDDDARLFLTGQLHGTDYIRDTQNVNPQERFNEREDGVGISSNIQIEGDVVLRDQLGNYKAQKMDGSKQLDRGGGLEKRFKEKETHQHVMTSEANKEDYHLSNTESMYVNGGPLIVPSDDNREDKKGKVFDQNTVTSEEDHKSRFQSKNDGDQLEKTVVGKDNKLTVQNEPQTTETNFSKDVDETVIQQDDGSPNWKKLFFSNLDDRARILLEEYTSILSNYKEAKKKLSEVEKNKRASLFRYCIQIKVLESSNALKDAEIQSLQKKLALFLDNESKTEKPTETGSFNAPDEQIQQNARADLACDATNESEHVTEDRTDVHQTKISSVEDDETHSASVVEERIRADIDELLDENIDFWMKFSSSLHQIQKFTTTVQDLQAEIAKVMEKKKQYHQNANANHHQTLITDIRPMYRHLSEIQTELTLWLDQNVVLKDDLQNRSSSLSSIQEEITRMSSAQSTAELSGNNDFQAAKFQGEVMNMKQENNRVVREVLSGQERVRNLQVEIEKTLKAVDKEFGISTRQSRYTAVHTKIPLRSFLFGVKLKKQKPSLFACMNPTLQRKYSDLSALPP